MREIKFRAWIDGKMMRNIDVLAISECTWSCPDYGKIGVNLAFQPSIVVMQYTGLKDRNGKEIYEGDILNCSYINPMSEETIKRYFSVIFEKGCFRAICIGHSPYGDTLLYFENNKGVVIGNIYENPELLEG